MNASAQAFDKGFSMRDAQDASLCQGSCRPGFKVNEDRVPPRSLIAMVKCWSICGSFCGPGS